MTNGKQRELLDKYLDGSASPEERAMVDSWYNELAKSDIAPPDAAGLYDTRDKMWTEISVHQPPVIRHRIQPGRVAAAIAASVLVLAGIFYLAAPKKKQSVPIASTQPANIQPGKTSATLTLSNGQKIVLSEHTAGNLAKDAGVAITKNEDGEIVYEALESNDGQKGINTLSTAMGETYQVKLPDGTRVWLNAGSSIQYPVSFTTASQRTVNLTGEAYFEVAHNKKQPFVVTTHNTSVEVLGTHFNINAYADEPGSKTTLLEGSIRLALRSSGKNQLMKPGQQASVKSDQIAITTVNPEESIAWKNGSFLFEDEALESILRKVSRWYNVKVVYEKPVSGVFFTGEISRSQPLSAVLNSLAKTGKASFKTEGNSVIVW